MRKAVAFAHVTPEHSGAVAGAAPSASSRILQLGKELQALREAASGVLENLWPDAPVPSVSVVRAGFQKESVSCKRNRK